MIDLREKVANIIIGINKVGLDERLVDENTEADEIISIVLDDAIDAVNKMEAWTDKYEAMDVIESLKEKDK